MNRVAGAAALLALAVLLWPGLGRTRSLAPRRGAPSSELSELPSGRGLLGARLPPRLTGWRRRTAVDREVTEILTLLDALAPALRAGLPPGEALRAVAPATGEPVPGLLAALVRSADRGEPLSAVWRASAEHLASADLGLVASAWSLCEHLGAPLAPTVATVGSVLRERRAVHRRMEAALAGPRASVTVLTALPAVGPLLALVMGLSPLDLYASAPGVASLTAGLVLLLFGRWWVARLVRSVGVDDSTASRRGPRRRPGRARGPRDG